VYPAPLSAHARKVIDMKVRDAAALVSAVLVCSALLAGCSSGPTPQGVADSYLAAWAHRDWPAMRALVASPPADFAAVNAAALTDLGAKQARYRPGHLTITGSTAHEPVTEQITLTGIGAVSIKTTLRLSKASGAWRVAWTPETIAPQLSKPGDHLSLQVTWPPRAQILGAGGTPLTRQAAMVTVGVEGERIKKEAVVRAALLTAGATTKAIESALAGAKLEPTWFEPVVTVSEARYQKLAPTIYPVPGTVFQTIHQRAPLTPGLDYLIGSVGPVTAQQLQTLGARYTAASAVGQTGLELAYQRQLAGQPGATITAVSPAGAAAAVATLGVRPGTAVQTSIDPAVQKDAEQALSGVHKEAALVAVDPTTGQILASVSVPPGGGFNLALDGSFPPGSSFKVLTSTALIEHGLTPLSPASCPPQLDVDGEIFHNAEGTAPAGDLLHAFAESCNTAFIGLATRHLTGADFTRTAAQYRLGTTPSIGLPAFAGSVPAPSDEAALAATAIGQGQVLVSPLNMAMVAAAVDSGQVRAARLVAGAADDSVPPVALPANVVTDLHQMMAQVVASGTAAGKGLPPGTYAKTGTAQYGHGNPLPTDAWLVGFNNHVWSSDIAFAMVTADGGEGGPTDGPIVAKFLDLLRRSGQ
jgi:cell division protein FtsI/penicillin-binding protein 2